MSLLLSSLHVFFTPRTNLPLPTFSAPITDTYHSLHFARKPSLSNSNSPQHPFASLPHDGAELAFLSRQAQAKAPHRKGVRPAPRWMMGGGVSV